MDGLNSLLTELGTNMWSMKFFITASLLYGSIPPNLIGGEFLNPVPHNYTCKQDLRSQCSFIDYDNNVTTPCTEWIYDTTMFHSTIAMEWNLVCERSHLQPLFQLLYTIGCIFGCAVGSFTASRFGRKKSMEFSVFLLALGSVCIMITNSYIILLVLRFMIGVANSMVIFPSFMLCMEICSLKTRPIAGVLLGFPYAVMTVGYSVMAYYIRDWRWLHMSGCCLLPFVILGLLFIDESPRWLLVNDQKDKALSILKKAASFSNKEYDEKYIENAVESMHLELSSKNVEKDDPWWSLVLSLFTHKDMRKITFIVTIIWFLQGIIYLGVPLNSDSFSSPYLYMGLIGMMELPAYSVSALITKKLGRKPVVGGSFVIAGLAVLAVGILNILNFKNEILDLVLILAGFLLVSTSFQVNFVYAPELFPTTIRPYGTGLCLLASQTGYNVPPVLTYYLGLDLDYLPIIIYSCCGLASGALTFLLPETNKKPLMETLADLPNLIHHNKKIKKENNKINL